MAPKRTALAWKLRLGSQSITGIAGVRTVAHLGARFTTEWLYYAALLIGVEARRIGGATFVRSITHQGTKQL